LSERDAGSHGDVFFDSKMTRDQEAVSEYYVRVHCLLV
jgi:hypothetical protein